MKSHQIFYYLFTLVVFAFTPYQTSIAQTPIKYKGPYFGISPTQTPKLLAPDLLASSLEEYNGTFSPDGKEFFYTTNTPNKGIITYTKMNADQTWSTPIIANFSGEYSEYDPLFAPDGKRLYFSSERPTPDSTQNDRTNIWYVERNENSWSSPQYVALSPNGDYFSSLTNNGFIYFNIWNNGDLFKATKKENEYVVERLPDGLNTDNGEGDPFIAPDESYLIFRGYNNTLGNGDLYISFNINGEWTKPENLGEPINSAAHEICPYVTADGKYFIFASGRINTPYVSEAGTSISGVRAQHKSADNGELNVYYISADFIEIMRTKWRK